MCAYSLHIGEVKPGITYGLLVNQTSGIEKFQ